MQKWLLLQLILIVNEIWFFPFHVMKMHCSWCSWVPRAEKLKKSFSLKYKILEEEFIIPLEAYLVRTLSISVMTILHFSYLGNFIRMHLIYFLTKNFFWFVKCLFATCGDTCGVNLPQSVKESTPCCIYRFNQPSWKIHGIV